MAFDVTDKWLEDPRRGSLIEKIGEITTDGTAFKLWRLAFLYFKRGELVPTELFDRVPNSDLFVQEGLAERRTDGVYVRGSKDAFKWYDAGISQRTEAGKKSAEARRKKFGSAIPINASNASPDQGPNAPQRDRTESERNPNETEPLSPSPSPVPDPAAGDSRARGAPAAASAEANALGGAPPRATLGLDQNSNVGRALGAVPADIIADWRSRWTDESIRVTAKKIVNKLIAKEGSFDKVNWRVRLTNCIENETESLVRRPPPKFKEPPPPPEQLFEVTQPTAEELSALATKRGTGAAEVIARLAKAKAMSGKTA